MTESPFAPFTLPAGTPLTGERYTVENPAKPSEAAGSYPLIDPAGLDGIVAAAAAAQPGWDLVPPSERWQLMADAAAGVDAAALAPLLVQEQGKVLAEATLEAGILSMVIDDHKPQRDWLIENAAQARDTLNVVYRPIGVVGVISPWNWPVRIAANGVIPGLLAGNSVILHLPPTAPLVAAQVYGAIAAALPENVLTVLTHPEPVLASGLVAHPGVRKISFTGSTPVGEIVMRDAAKHVKAVTLELGGNDPAIVLDDLEPTPELIDSLIGGAFMTTGQVCVAIKRLYVPQAKLADYVRVLGERLDAQVLGNGLDPASTLGPLHSRAQRDRVAELVQAARDAGATVSEHGTRGADFEEGWFLLPTLVHGIADDARLVVEEQFGPALPVLGYDSIDDVVARANDSEFALGSSVWSDDLDAAYAVANRIEAGTTWINAHGGAARQGEAPLAGHKMSGVGAVTAQWGLHAVMQPHAILR